MPASPRPRDLPSLLPCSDQQENFEVPDLPFDVDFGMTFPAPDQLPDDGMVGVQGGEDVDPNRGATQSPVALQVGKQAQREGGPPHSAAAGRERVRLAARIHMDGANSSCAHPASKSPFVP